MNADTPHQIIWEELVYSTLRMDMKPTVIFRRIWRQNSNRHIHITLINCTSDLLYLQQAQSVKLNTFNIGWSDLRWIYMSKYKNTVHKQRSSRLLEVHLKTCITRINNYSKFDYVLRKIVSINKKKGSTENIILVNVCHIFMFVVN